MNIVLFLTLYLINIRLCEASDQKFLLKKVVFYRYINPSNHFNYYSFTNKTEVVFTTFQENSLELAYESLNQYNTSSFASLFFKNLQVQYIVKETCFGNNYYDFQLGKRICYENLINLNVIKNEGITNYKAPVLTYKVLFDDEIFLCKFEALEITQKNSNQTVLSGLIYGFNKEKKRWMDHLDSSNKCNDFSKMEDVQFLDNPFFKNMPKDITNITSAVIKDDLTGDKKNDKKVNPLLGIIIKRFENSAGFFIKEAEVEFLPKKNKALIPIYGSLEQKNNENDLNSFVDQFFQLKFFSKVSDTDIFQYRVTSLSDDFILCKFVSNTIFLQKSIEDKGIILRGKIYASRDNGNIWDESKKDECSSPGIISDLVFINKYKLFLNVPIDYKINFSVDQKKINLKEEELTDQDFKELMSFFKNYGFRFKDFAPFEYSGMKYHQKKHFLYYDDENLKETYPGYYNFEEERLTDVLKNKDDLLKIKHLDLSANEINRLPVALFKLKNLTHLYLNDNHIEFLPEEIGWLKNLKFLNIDYNKLQMLPFSLQLIPSLKIWCKSQHFNFYDEEIPESIRKKVDIDSSNNRIIERLIDKQVSLN